MIYISKPQIDKNEIKAVIRVLESGKLVQGEEVKKLEERFNSFCKTKYSVATNNGTSALHTALLSVGVLPGDEVITTPFTFVATANAILMAGAKPIFADIDEDTFNIDPKEIEKKISKKTKAIVAVNLYGQPADYKAINKIAKRNNLIVIEDSAQSIGALYFNQKSGNLSDLACFSLYATKNITSGEGGMITTNSSAIAKKARIIRNQGQNEKHRYEYLGLGYNYRMMDISAAIAIEQMKKLAKFTKRRQEIARKYNFEIKSKGLIVPFIQKNTSSVYHQYTLRVTKDFKLDRESFKKVLEEKGIQSNIYYPTPLYKFDHLKFNNKSSDFPIAERASKEVISIPVHPGLTNQEVKTIINTINNI